MSSMGRDTEEYQRILTRYDVIIDQLASARCSGVLADKLRSKGLITGPIYDEALNVGPGVVESTRIRPMINAVLAKVEWSTENYYIFMGVLQEIDGIEDTVQYVEAPLQQLGVQSKCPLSGPGTATEWSATWDASGRFLPPQNTLPVNQTPSLQTLILLPVAAQWHDLGLHLGVRPDVLDAIRKASKHETKLCKLMFTVWLRDDPSPTYEKLVRALAAVGKRNLAEPLLAARGVPLSVIGDIAAPQPRAKPIIPRAPPPPECVAKYAKYLKDKYKRMSVLPDGDWPPSIGRHYTRLALVENPRDLLPDAEFTSTMERDYLHGKIDNIVGRKKEIQVPEIFTDCPGETQLKILMDGAPGVGKTTLSRKMVCDWTNGVLLEQFHLVILLHLRDPRVREARHIKELFQTDGPQFQQDVIQHILDTAGEHVLFIFDGYDELSYEERTCNSLFLDIIEGRSLHNCSVLVTSRPYASDHLQQLNCINRHVEVLGFTKEQIESCIKLSIPDEQKASSLVNLLQERMDIISLCYTPLNCAIMLYVYKQEQHTLPDTLTGLYEAFIVNSLKKHARNLCTSEQRLLNSATSLHGIPVSVQKQLDILSKLALKGLSKDKMIFSYMDVVSAFSANVDADVEDNFLGLMTGFSRTIHAHYQFIHLSVQEFLAARWAAAQLVLLSDDEQVVYFHHNIKEDRFRFMLIFLAGISKLNFKHANQILSGSIDLRCSEIDTDFVPLSKVHFFFFILQFIFETENLSLYGALKTAVTDHAINICWYKLTAFDCVLLARFLHWSNCTWKLLNLKGCGLTDHSLEILHKVSLSQPSSTTCIEVVDLSHCSFSTLPQITWFENTSKMTIEGAPVGLDFVHTIGSMKRLHCLCVGSKESGSIWVVCVFNLLEHNTNLVECDFSWNSKLTENEGWALERMLTVNTGLRTLKLSKCGISDVTAKHIGVGLAENKSLRVLDISQNDIHSDGAVNIFTSLEHNTSLEELYLSQNSRLTERDSEVVGWALERMMTVNCTLKVLHLHCCGLNGEVLYHLATGLTHATGITELNISTYIFGNNDISSQCWVHLFKTLIQNSSLKKLNISWNKLGLQETETLAEMLACNKSLTELNVAECYDRDTQVAELEVLARGLLNNTTMQRLVAGYHYSEVMKFLEANLNTTEGCSRTSRLKIISERDLELLNSE